MSKKRLAAIWLLPSLLWSTVFAGSVVIPGGGANLSVPVDSFQEQRFDRIFQQEYDFSCGSAALASLLSFHYGAAFTEEEVFLSMLALADRQKVREQGFSMLDMKRFLESEGYQADGFRMPLSGLKETIRLPTIVLLNRDGFRHFVIIKGISETEVLVGDPARGLKVYSHKQFESYWDGTAFVIRSHLEQGRSAFLGREEWPEIAAAPLRRGLSDPSVGQSLPYWPSPGEW